MMEKMRQTVRSFFGGRYGLDGLGKTTLVLGLALYSAGLLTGVGLFATLGILAAFVTLFRAMSRNALQRGMENRLYLAKTADWRKSARQAAVRLKNSRTYKYFRCPCCRTWLRLPRGAGQVKVTCPKCKTIFEKSA